MASQQSDDDTFLESPTNKHHRFFPSSPKSVTIKANEESSRKQTPFFALVFHPLPILMI